MAVCVLVCCERGVSVFSCIVGRTVHVRTSAVTEVLLLACSDIGAFGQGHSRSIILRRFSVCGRSDRRAHKSHITRISHTTTVRLSG